MIGGWMNRSYPAAVLAAAFIAAPLGAQEVGAPSRPPAGPRMGRSVETALQHREELGLSGEQVAALEELQARIRRDVEPLAEELRSLRDRVRKGELDREEGWRKIQEVRGRLMTASAPLRGRVAEILTAAQHRRLQSLLRRGRARPPGMMRGGGMARGRMLRMRLRSFRGGGAWLGRPGVAGRMHRGMRMGRPGLRPWRRAGPRRGGGPAPFPLRGPGGRG